MRLTRYVAWFSGLTGACIWSVALAAAIVADPATVTWLTSVSEATTAILGVPLPVLMGAIGGAFLARSYARPDMKYLTAVIESIAWTFAGCLSAPVVLEVTEKSGFGVPTAALALIALLIAALGPKLFPILAEGSSQYLRRWVDRHSGRRDDDVAK